jgi:hypothetical protein
LVLWEERSGLVVGLEMKMNLEDHDLGEDLEMEVPLDLLPGWVGVWGSREGRLLVVRNLWRGIGEVAWRRKGLRRLLRCCYLV